MRARRAHDVAIAVVIVLVYLFSVVRHHHRFVFSVVVFSRVRVCSSSIINPSFIHHSSILLSRSRARATSRDVALGFSADPRSIDRFHGRSVGYIHHRSVKGRRTIDD